MIATIGIVVGAVAAISGGGWKLYTYRKSRTGKLVLDIETQGAWQQQASAALVQVRVVLANTATSRIQLIPAGTAVLVSVLAALSTSSAILWPAPMAVRSLVTGDVWLEPGEKKRIDLLINSGLSTAGVARLQTRVVYAASQRRNHLEGSTEVICTATSTIK